MLTNALFINTVRKKVTYSTLVFGLNVENTGIAVSMFSAMIANLGKSLCRLYPLQNDKSLSRPWRNSNSERSSTENNAKHFIECVKDLTCSKLGLR